MIRSLHIERFKRFRSLHLPFGDLTLLTGLNGAGKTSVIHALLLSREAARGSNRGIALNGHTGMNLGEAPDVLHRGAEGDSIDILVHYDDDEVASKLVMTLPEDRALYLAIAQRPGVTGDAQGLTADPPKFTYLCAERLGPRDTLSADSADVSAIGVGVSGEHTAQVLALALLKGRGASTVSAARLAPIGDATMEALSRIGPQVELWISLILGLPGTMRIDAEWFPGTTVTRLRFKMPGQVAEWTRPPNMGFGVSYVLPIVVAALLTPAGGLLIVENPEAHLHPAGQSMMGEFLARMAADGVQVVMETHSDHVVNGVRRAVAEKKAALDPDRVALHFFGGGGTSGDGVTAIGLRDSGDLTAWPRGFFDQIERDLGAIARTRRRRQG